MFAMLRSNVLGENCWLHGGYRIFSLAVWLSICIMLRMQIIDLEDGLHENLTSFFFFYSLR